MLRRFEDFAAVGSFAFEHCAAVVHGVSQDVHSGVAPGHEFAIEPYPAVPIVESLTRHGVLLISSKGPTLLLISPGSITEGSDCIHGSRKYVNETDLMATFMPTLKSEERSASDPGDAPMYDLIELFYF